MAHLSLTPTRFQLHVITINSSKRNTLMTTPYSKSLAAKRLQNWKIIQTIHAPDSLSENSVTSQKQNSSIVHMNHQKSLTAPKYSEAWYARFTNKRYL